MSFHSLLNQDDVWSHILTFVPRGRRNHLQFMVYCALPLHIRQQIQQGKQSIELKSKLLPLPDHYVSYHYIRLLHTFYECADITKRKSLDFLDYEVGKTNMSLMEQAVKMKKIRLMIWLHEHTYVTGEAAMHAYNDPRILFYMYKKKIPIDDGVFQYACEEGCAETVVSLIRDHGRKRYQTTSDCLHGLFAAAKRGHLLVIAAIYKLCKREEYHPKLDYREFSRERFVGIYAMHYGHKKVADWVWHNGVKWTQKAIDYVCHKKNDYDITLKEATKNELEAYLKKK
jgi:hypothetical protein